MVSTSVLHTEKEGSIPSSPTSLNENSQRKFKNLIEEIKSKVIKQCPKCNSSHKKKGIFCSRSCANSRKWSEETIKKRSASMKKVWARKTKEEKQEIINKRVKRNIEFHKNKRKITSTENLGRDTIRRKLIEEQENKCDECNIEKWQDKYIILELEHIDGNKENNIRENLRMLCPNCHSQTPTWKIGYKRLSKIKRPLV